MTDAAKVPAKEAAPAVAKEAAPAVAKVEFKKYKCLNPIEHNGKSYATGSEIKLDPETAQNLLRLGAIVDPTPKPEA
jgi:hypothetical protein